MYCGTTTFARKLNRQEKENLLHNCVISDELQDVFDERLDYIFGQILVGIGINPNGKDEGCYFMSMNNADRKSDLPRGYFDNIKYYNHIGIHFFYPLDSEYTVIPYACKYLDCLSKIKTNWLFTDFEQELSKEIKNLFEQKTKKDSLYPKYELLKNSILAKLSDEEKQIIEIKEFYTDLFEK